MHYKVIALKNETYTIVPVRIPIGVGKRRSGLSVDLQIARSIRVKPAQHVQQRGLATPRRAEYAYKLAFSERNGDTVKRIYVDTAFCAIYLCY